MTGIHQYPNIVLTSGGVECVDALLRRSLDLRNYLLKNNVDDPSKKHLTVNNNRTRDKMSPNTSDPKFIITNHSEESMYLTR